MANFDINILDNIDYISKTNNENFNECEGLDITSTIKLSDLIANYTGSFKELYIVNISSNESGFYFKYNKVEITNLNLPLKIDVNNPEDNINNLVIRKLFTPTLSTSTLSISFYIKDTNGNNGDTVTSTFNINKVTCDIIYTSKINSSNEEECVFLDDALPIKLLDTGINNAIINSYTGNPHSKLVITGVSYNVDLFYIQYNNVKLSEVNLPLEIDISLLAIGDTIPLLELVRTFAPTRFASLVAVNFYIEDSIGNKGLTLSTKFQILKKSCTTPDVCDPYISNLNYTYNV